MYSIIPQYFIRLKVIFQKKPTYSTVHVRGYKGLDGGKGENEYHVIRVLADFIVLFLPNYVIYGIPDAG